jgi:hypothetical protein
MVYLGVGGEFHISKLLKNHLSNQILMKIYFSGKLVNRR